MRILVIEDEPRMLALLSKGLYEHGFAVMTAADGTTGLEIATGYEFGSIVLDIGLPRLDGYGLLQALRARGRATPVLMLTARDTEDDIIRGLDLGADDYLTKPFSFMELLARLQSIMRTKQSRGIEKIEAGEVVLDSIQHSVTRNNRRVNLTRHEFLLLSCLVRGAGSCVQRRTLVECVWGGDYPIGPSALDVLVNSLRNKIDSPFESRVIHTVRGSGYMFRTATSEAAEQSV